MATRTRPGRPSVPGPEFTAAQNEDGTPHFAYYAQPQLLSFIWDGLQSTIQVCHGGYGEPVEWVFDAPALLYAVQAYPATILTEFQKACDEWLLTEWQAL